MWGNELKLHDQIYAVGVQEKDLLLVPQLTPITHGSVIIFPLVPSLD